MKLNMNHILEVSLPQIIDFFKQHNEKSFRAKQIWQWIYEKKIVDLDLMINIPQATKILLKEHFSFDLPKIYHKADSEDGTTKLLFKNNNNRSIETVIMRYEGRTSLCVSSQVGCKLACTFCQTGKLGFVSHLTKAEIIGQFIRAHEILKDENKKITHVVFMGMGEPLDNYEPVINSVNSLINEEEFGLSQRRVTLSTSGIVPKIYSLVQDTKASLAVSLHSATEQLRTDLMPINKKYSLSDLKDSLMHYQKETGKMVTLEFILIKNTNCNIKEAKALVKFIHGLRAKVNLIPFNPHPGLGHEKPSEQEIEEFQKYLSARNIPAPVRYSKGLDISGACGQLAAKNQELTEGIPKRSNLI